MVLTGELFLICFNIDIFVFHERVRTGVRNGKGSERQFDLPLPPGLDLFENPLPAPADRGLVHAEIFPEPRLVDLPVGLDKRVGFVERFLNESLVGSAQRRIRPEQILQPVPQDLRQPGFGSRPVERTDVNETAIVPTLFLYMIKQHLMSDLADEDSKMGSGSEFGAAQFFQHS